MEAFYFNFLDKVITLQNFTLDLSSVPEIFATGDYKVYVILKLRNEIMAHVTVYTTIVSSNKDTFG